MLEITVVVGNHQGAGVLGDCLESLNLQTRPPAEVIVVDGASTDASAEVAGKNGARWIQTDNKGLGYLYNRGGRAATTEYVLFANNDIALDQQCLALLGDALDERTRLFAADARQMDWTGANLVHARATLRRGRHFHELLPGFELDQKSPANALVPTVTANGACMLVRRRMLLELDGFDETFFMDFEDIDLCWRAWLRGWGTVYVPEAFVRHRVGAVTTAAVLPRRIAASHHNLIRFALKCLPAREALLIVATELARVPRHRGLVLRPLAEITRELPAILRLRRLARPSKALLAWFLEGQQGNVPLTARGTARYR